MSRFPASDNVKRIGQSLLRNYRCICKAVNRSSFPSTYRIHDSYNGSYFGSRILTYRYGSAIVKGRRQSLWNISDIRKFHGLSGSGIFSSKCRVDWKGILQIHTYGGLALSCINRAAMAVVFALSRSHLIRPGLLAFIIKELAFSENEWALAEQLAATDTFYDRAQNGRLYFALLFLSLLEVAILFLRAIYLAILFSPCMAMAPLADSLGAKFRKFWLDILHHTLERAGPAFIKWGQWAATRPDLFPKDLCSQLAKLQTEAPAHGFDFTKRAVEGAFGRKLPEIFEKFEEKPVASGSVAQVHRATLKFQYPGQPIKPILVAVKVRHPGVGEAIRRDFAIIDFVARISNLVPTLRWLRLDESVQQFAVFMMSQVDLAREAAQLSRFLYNFRKWKDVSFPRPLYPLVHPAVLVETFEHGQSIMHYVDELEGNYDIKSSLANIGSNALLKMLLVDNFIHADMHPGNILVRLTRSKISRNQLFQSKPHVIFLDVGMTAELSKKDRLNLLEFFKAVAYMDGRTAAQCTLEFSKQQKCPNPKAFVEEVDKYFRHLVSPEGSGNHPADCMQHLLELVRHHKVNIDGNVCTVIVTTLVLEGWQRKLDPGYDVMHTLRTLLFKADWAESLAYTLETLASP